MSQKYQEFSQENEQQLDVANDQDTNQTLNIYTIFIKTQKDQKLQFEYDNTKNQSVQYLKQQVFPQESLDVKKKIKLIFKGKLLDDKNLLNDYQFEPNCFIHAMVNDIPQEDLEAQQENQIEVQNQNQLSADVNILLREYLSTVSVIRTQNNEVIQQRLQQQLYQARLGNNLELLFGFVIGFFIVFFGLLMVTYCNNLSIKYKTGLILGIFSRIVWAFIEITLYQSNQ